MKAGDNEIVSVVQTAEVESYDISDSAHLEIGFRPKRIHLFDCETEESLLY